MEYTTKKAQEVAAMSSYHVAGLADGSVSNNEAEEFWDSLRVSIAEAIDYSDGNRPDEDAIHEIADAAPSIWNKEVMLQAVGTNAYTNECPYDDDHEDMVVFAKHLLYEMARVATEAVLDKVGLGER